MQRLINTIVFVLIAPSLFIIGRGGFALKPIGIIEASTYTKGINTTFLKLSIPEGDYCGDGENMALNYIFECDETLDDLVITNKDEFDDTVCTNTIKMKTKYGKKEIIIIFII